MTWTSAVGRSCKWLLYKIVHGLALTRISPNALTFIGLLINIAKGAFDAAGMYAAIVVIMVVALAAEYVMTLVENRLAKWRPAPLQDAN